MPRTGSSELSRASRGRVAESGTGMGGMQPMDKPLLALLFFAFALLFG
jgi:hypothetical protein